MKLRESQIQETCADWLALDGWLRRIKTDLRHLRGMGVQEKGIPDDCFIRYEFDRQAKTLCDLGLDSDTPIIANDTQLRAMSQVLWIEWKARDGVIGQKQAEWHQLERARGALVWVAKQDFPAAIEGFQDHYRKSGLLQRSGL